MWNKKTPPPNFGLYQRLLKETVKLLHYQEVYFNKTNIDTRKNLGNQQIIVRDLVNYIRDREDGKPMLERD